ncbi:phox (PX) domain-containing protein [Tasmannia lanceolata]|uniref:phox (PX) domain-containing protein n=1 Tax=Tasmannia lanceolata TaxID=3420 RepID=UPI004063071D
MSTGRQTVRDLIEEAKKRIVLLFVCVVGLSYLMSLTSSSVWMNLPAAASLIVLIRYFSHDLEMRRRVAANKRSTSSNNLSQKIPLEVPKDAPEKSDWRRKVNSPIVEAAIDQFTRHLVSEWVTNLWYSRLTPDMDAPEELVHIMNGVLGEISFRVRDINLIDLLTRDIISLICNNLELYRTSQAKIGKCGARMLPIDHHDTQLKLVMASENKLHPALFSTEAEHKVLQHLMGGLISFTFKPEELQCSFFRYTVRELLACAVMRPVLNLANPRLINERIENFVHSLTNKAGKGFSPSAGDSSQTKAVASSRTSSDRFSVFLDRTNNGVELVQLKHDQSGINSDKPVKRIANGAFLRKDSEHSESGLSVGSNHANAINGDAQSSHSRSSLLLDGKNGEWGQMLDIISSIKTQTLAPEHFENMWAKGRNYKKKEGANQANQVAKSVSVGNSDNSDCLRVSSKHRIQGGKAKSEISRRNTDYTQHNNSLIDGKSPSQLFVTLYDEKPDHDPVRLPEIGPDSDNSDATEDDDSSGITGLDSPGTKVWDSINNRKAVVSHIRHPLESSEGHLTRKSDKGNANYKRLSKTQSGRKRSRSSSNKGHVWQEVERTSFLLGDGQDILNASKGDVKADESSNDSELESWGRVHGSGAASSSAPSFSVSGAPNSSVKSPENSTLADFLKLRCEVLGANVVKSDSRTFAVYSISVTDANNNNWSIKRRFRHFEELHRRLKEFPEYNLGLPPKHFLSSGLDMFVIQERCKLLDTYLKKLVHLPTLSGSIEVWDFLSVDSQTYMFSNSLSIIQTLSVDLDEKGGKFQNSIEAVNDQILSREEYLGTKSNRSAAQTKQNHILDNSVMKTRNAEHFPTKKPGKESVNLYEDHSGSDSDDRLKTNVSSSSKTGKAQKNFRGTDDAQEASQSLHEAAADPTLPNEWVPPNLSIPILDLVDIIFQLQDGGWIRRQAFWVAKQVLQLGMGDAFDDWLIEKIQLLRKGSVIASGIKRIEQILWPDGIFITKHPRRQRPPPSVIQSQNSHLSSHSQPMNVSLPKKEANQTNNPKESNSFTDEQELEASRRAKFVHELMIDKAPAALVGLVGRKVYERAAQDIYFFLQSPVCLKQMAYDLLELLLLLAFPELDSVVKQCHEEKERFGEFKPKQM